MQPNTYCKNENCKNGIDGGRKFYYACKNCARTESWKAVACCKECFLEYANQVEEGRAKNKPISTIPERTDMTVAQYKKLMKTPIAEVKNESIQEIIDGGYGDDLKELGYAKTIEKINIDIDESNSAEKEDAQKASVKKRTRRKKSD